ncbi:hypothetical protein Q33_0019 [Lactococcus phage Q33]|uniref:Uncharacterized protein n=1 Tax=Lactococcus phage Q33 TaxID=254253 RepID=R9QNG8_9CAUD|nr:hypothetical protein H1N73_gp19 [Lactococcus phage Q33]AFV51048.1 hypothetical protein Q33_0019 [Lactococcus phage Q33]
MKCKKCNKETVIALIHENYGYIERLNHFMDNLSRTS